MYRLMKLIKTELGGPSSLPRPESVEAVVDSVAVVVEDRHDHKGADLPHWETNKGYATALGNGRAGTPQRQVCVCVCVVCVRAYVGVVCWMSY